MFIYQKNGKVFIEHGLSLTEQRNIENFVYAKSN